MVRGWRLGWFAEDDEMGRAGVYIRITSQERIVIDRGRVDRTLDGPRFWLIKRSTFAMYGIIACERKTPDFCISP